MPTAQGNTAIYLLPGMQARLIAPGFWVGTGDRKRMLETGEYETVSLINGFSVENTDVGTIEPGDTPNSVVYTHKKFALNKVTFFASTGEIGEIDIIAVPIHDHSSVVTGGPAFGTYFTDDETI